MTAPGAAGTVDILIDVENHLAASSAGSERVRLAMLGLVHVGESGTAARTRQIRGYSKMQPFEGFRGAARKDPDFRLIDVVAPEWSWPGPFPAGDIVPVYAVEVGFGNDRAEKQLIAEYERAERDGVHAERTVFASDDWRVWKRLELLFRDDAEYDGWIVGGVNVTLDDWLALRAEQYPLIPRDRVLDLQTIYLRAYEERRGETPDQARRRLQAAQVRGEGLRATALVLLDELAAIDWARVASFPAGSASWRSALESFADDAAGWSSALGPVRSVAFARGGVSPTLARDLLGRIVLVNRLAGSDVLVERAVNRLMAAADAYVDLRNAWAAARVQLAEARRARKQAARTRPSRAES
jgi:hypothetical protein